MRGFDYAFRYGDGDHVKVGKTNNLDKRRSSLQVAHHHPLELVECIEHVDYAEGEKYLHKLLAPWRVRGGSREHFFVGDAELAEAFEETRRYLDVELPRLRQLPQFEALEAGEDIVPPTEDLLSIKHRRREVQAGRARAQAEMDRLEEEVREVCRPVWQRQRRDRERLTRLMHEADVEEAQLVTTVKLAIGPAAGIDGVATWRTVEGRHYFDPESLKAADPDMFDRYRTKFDPAHFKRDQGTAAYKAHMRARTYRVFQWDAEAEPATEELFPRGAQLPRWSVKRRLVGTSLLHALRRRR